MTEASLFLVASRADGTPLATRLVGPAGAWIGRAATCELSLPDPDRHVSARHCRIDFADGSFWITDQSTNGTFLNGSPAPLPTGQRQPLAAGDRLRVGTYVVAASQPSADATLADVPLTTIAGTGPTSPLLDPPWALPSQGPDPATMPLIPDSAFPTPNPAPQAGAADALSALLTDLLNDPVPPPPVPPAPSAPPPVPTAPPSPAPDRLPQFTHMAAPEPVAAEPMAPLPTPPPPPPPPSSSTVDDLVSALASDLAGPVVPAAQPIGALDLYPPDRSGTAATRALAAFWCGLGVMPSGLDPAGLSAVMMELGAALRESVEGFSDLLGPASADGHGTANPFADGHGALRRAIEHRGRDAPRVDEMVRAVFAAAAEREDAYIAAVRAAVQHALRSMTPTALESRFGPLLQSRRQTSRRAELMELMYKMEAELVELAEAQFRKELAGLMRQRIRKRVTFENGGSHG